MCRITFTLSAALTIAFLAFPSLGVAQTNGVKYQPLSNQEMSQLRIWDQWVKTFNEMTAKQKAEVMRRHLTMCLDAFQLTDEQRSFVKESASKFATEETYGTTEPEKRAEIQRQMKLVQEKAMSLLGPDLAKKIFADKPPFAVLEAVKNDPSLK